MTPLDVLELRQELQLTRAEFSTWLSVDPRTVHRWERGRSRPEGTGAAVMRAALEVIREAPNPGSRSRVVAFLRRRARLADLVQDVLGDVAKPRVVK